MSRKKNGKFFAMFKSKRNNMSQEKEFNEEIDTTGISDSQENTTENEVVDNPETEANENQATEPTAEEKYAELNDKFIRLYSEFDNYRKRTNKEKIDKISIK